MSTPLTESRSHREPDVAPPPDAGTRSASASHLAPAVARVVDPICDRFESAWKAASPSDPGPSAEEYLGGVEGPARSVLLRELLALEVAYRRRRGEAPTAAEFRERFPGQETVIDSLCGASPAPSGQGDTTPHGPTPPADPAATRDFDDPNATRDTDQPAAETPSLPLPSIPGYELLEELGRGGMGVVYQARQASLHRVVALKMVLAGGHASEAELARFRTEAEAVARLQHPNIVQIHEVGEHGGLPFFALEFCAGGSLDQKLNGTPLPPKEAARLVETLARAMQAAHRAGVVHRDLKPQNVLLSTDGTLKVTDFGLAKLTDEAGRTQSGAVMGTPSYMAPEQAGGKSKEIGPAADVYALGAVLYECLTGRPPFKAATAWDTIMQVVADDPVPPRQLQPKTPRDLETICLKCLQKEPKKRYATAEALAEDLRRFQAGEPVGARPVSRASRLWRWCRRNPAVAALSAAFALSLLAGTAFACYFAVEASAEAREARRQQGLAEDNARRADAKADEAQESARLAREERMVSARSHYVTDLRQAEQAWEDDDLQRLRELLAGQMPERTGGVDLRHFEWYYWQRVCHFESRTLTGHTAGVGFVAFSPDGRRLASTSPNEVKLWDADTGRETPLLREDLADSPLGWMRQEVGLSAPSPGKPAFSPDSKLLAVPWGMTVKVWDAQTGKHQFTLWGHTTTVCDVAFSPDGRLIATASEDKTAKVWDVPGGRVRLTLRGHTDRVSAVAFSPDGKRLATSSDDQTVKLWDAETGRDLLTLAPSQPYWDVFFSPDGKLVAATSIGKNLQVWDAQTGKPLLSVAVGQADGLNGAVFSPDSRLLATAQDNAAKVWDVQTGKEVVVLNGHTDQVNGVTFSPDGKRLATASQDRTAVVWLVATGQRLLVRKGHTDAVKAVAFSPDGRRLATASDDQTVKLWDSLAEQESQPLPGGQGIAAFSPDGKRVVLAGWGLQELNTTNWQPLRTLLDRQHVIDAVAFSPDGRLLASGEHGGTAIVWDAAAGRELHTLKGHVGGDLTCLAFSPDSRLLAVGSWWPDEANTEHGLGCEVKVWQAQPGRELLNLRGHTLPITGVAFSPDGKRLATASEDGTIKLWDAETGSELATLKGHTGRVYSVAFSPDGKVLASSAEDRTIKLWEPAEARLLLTMRGHNGGVRQVCFSKDGLRLASISEDDTVKVWEASSGQELTTLKMPQGQVDNFAGVSFHTDGKCLAAGGRVWDGRPQEGQAAATAP